MNKFAVLLTIGLFATMCFAVIGCDDEEDADEELLDIAGSYFDGYADHSISEDTWSITYEGEDPYLFHIAEFSNEDQYVVAQNDASYEWNPNDWSLFEWTFDGDDLYYCQSVLDAKTQEDALNGASADASDLTGGCAGWSWTLLTPDA